MRKMCDHGCASRRRARSRAPTEGVCPPRARHSIIVSTASANGCLRFPGAAPAAGSDEGRSAGSAHEPSLVMFFHLLLPTSSTRRFLARPSSPRLSATGFPGRSPPPKPLRRRAPGHDRGHDAARAASDNTLFGGRAAPTLSVWPSIAELSVGSPSSCSTISFTVASPSGLEVRLAGVEVDVERDEAVLVELVEKLVGAHHLVIAATSTIRACSSAWAR